MTMVWKTKALSTAQAAITALALAALFLIATPAYSQEKDRLYSNEFADLRLWKIRAKMDSIRTQRPSVALVLSGGGAKGAAHVGVIKYLESIGMPVDIVLGTSMGGLVGGIYALGYDASQLDTLIRSIDWNVALSDKVPREYRSYTSLKYKEKYVLSFPFYYAPKDFADRNSGEGPEFQPRSSDIRFGAGESDANRMVSENLIGSLPSGMIYGQNVNNIFSSLSVGYQDDIDFYDLPVPFLCVAADLVSGAAKIWTKGKINTALRSTMSIPGLFAPVRVDGMVLVDGGIRNNYPTDLARRVGADIVIGVNLSEGYKEYSQINNIGDIISAGIDMLGRGSFETNVNIADVTINPSLPEYGMLSFDSESIDTIISRGYVAAKRMSAKLDSIRLLTGPAAPMRQRRPADDIRKRKVIVEGVEILGIDDRESSYLMNNLMIAAGTRIGNREIEDAVAAIYGTDSFDYVNYELLGPEEPYRLKFNCKKGPKNQVGLSARFDTEEIVSVLLNIGVGVHKLQGSSVDIVGKVGTNPQARVTYSYVAPKGMAVNAMGGIRYTDRNMFSIGDNRFRINFLDCRQEFFLSNIKWSKFFFKVGVRNDFYKVSSLMAEQVTGDYDVNQLSNDYITFFLNGRADSFDNGYIPTKGTSTGISYDWVFGGFPNRFNNFHALQFDFKKVVGGDGFAFLPSINARYLIGEEVPVPFSNTMGGSIAGRYLDQQMPFIGINNAASMMKFLAIARGDFRVRLFKNNYLSTILNYAVTTDDFLQLKDSGAEAAKHNFGAGIEYVYNTIVGPIGANIHWSNYTGKLGAYLSLGFNF